MMTELEELLALAEREGTSVIELVQRAHDLGWREGATHAVHDHWDEDDLDALVNPGEAEEAMNEECGASYSTGGADPYSSTCDRHPGHYPATQHEGPDPFGNEGRIRWSGGGTCAGDPLPYTHVEHVDK